MAYEKKTVQEYIAETDDKTVEGFNDNQEDRINTEFVALDQITSNITNRLGSYFRMVAQGYGMGVVIDEDLTVIGAIYVLITGRWNAMHIISWDRGDNVLVSSAVLEYSRVVVSVSGTRLTVNLTANGEYILYRVK